jgi:hypothetical protein
VGGLVGGRVLAGGIQSHLIHLDRELSLSLLGKFIYEEGTERQSLYSFALCNNFCFKTWNNYIPNELAPYKHKRIPYTELSSLQSLAMVKLFYVSGGWGKYATLGDFLKSRVEYEKVKVPNWCCKFEDSDDEMKGDWAGKQSQEAFRIDLAVKLYENYKDSSSSDRTHSTRKLLKLFLDKVNMDYTGLKFNLVETWKKYFNMA